jgi:hypothetical protein
MTMLAALAFSIAVSGPSPGPAGALRGMVVDEVDYLPRQGVTLLLQCACDMKDRTVSSGADGTFAFEGLAPARYRLTLYGGTGLVEYGYELAPGQERALVLAVAPQRLPASDTRGLPVYSGYSSNARLRAAQVELSIGGVLLAGGFMMMVGAVVEATKPDCPGGPQSCGAPPRPRVARGLAFGAVLSATGGGVLVGLGAAHRRQYRLGLSAHRDGGGLVFAGRF